MSSIVAVGIAIGVVAVAMTRHKSISTAPARDQADDKTVDGDDDGSLEDVYLHNDYEFHDAMERAGLDIQTDLVDHISFQEAPSLFGTVWSVPVPMAKLGDDGSGRESNDHMLQITLK
jgi:hypothetical protein